MHDSSISRGSISGSFTSCAPAANAGMGGNDGLRLVAQLTESVVVPDIHRLIRRRELLRRGSGLQELPTLS